MNKLWTIVPAAGVGSRVGADCPKQYLPLTENDTLLESTLKRLFEVPAIEQVTLVLGADDGYWPELTLSGDARIERAVGGKERCDSVLNGLLSLAEKAAQDDWVLVHDAARPCVRVSDIENMLASCEQNNQGGILAMRVRDTMKQAAGLNIAQTIDRSQLWHAFTPQCFRYGELVNALQIALSDGFAVTDEASAMEYAGQSPLLIESHSDNIKVTLPQDIHLARFYLQQQAEEVA